MSQCYESAMCVVEEMSAKLGKVYKLDRKKMAFFKEICDVVETFSNDIACDVLDVGVTCEQNDFVFTLISDDITLDSNVLMKSIVDTLPMLDVVKFSKAKYDDKSIVKLRTDLIISRLWVGADE